MFSDSDGLVGGDFLQTKYDACSVLSFVSAGAAMAILSSYMIPIISIIIFLVLSNVTWTTYKWQYFLILTFSNTKF